MTPSQPNADAATETFFGEPVTWRAEAAERLGITDDDLPAAISPGAAFPAVLRTIIDSLPQVEVIVDVGSGAGGASEYLRRATGATVYAVEPSDLARRTARRCFPHLHQVDGTASHTGLPDGFADAVVMCGVLSLIPEPRGVMAEVTRLLKPGGHVAIADLFATGHADVHAEPNVFRAPESVIDLCATHGLAAAEVALGDPSLDPQWAAIAAKVDEWIERECCDRQGYGAWRRDREHLDHYMANGEVLGGCVVAARAPADAAPVL